MLKVPNAALRYRPPVGAEEIRALYLKYGIEAEARGGAPPADQAVVWKLHADKSLEPVAIGLGITDHTYTAVARIGKGELKERLSNLGIGKPRRCIGFSERLDGSDDAQGLNFEFEKLPDFAPAMLLRMARCFYEMDKKWEAMVVYQEILNKYKDAASREPALFGMVVAGAEVGRPEQARLI